MSEPLTPEDAQRTNEAMRRLARMDRAEVDEVTTSLREEAARNHFAERLELAFRCRRTA
jgi:hypothetical protein